jgi:hypothetical protein
VQLPEIFGQIDDSNSPLLNQTVSSSKVIVNSVDFTLRPFLNESVQSHNE